MKQANLGRLLSGAEGSALVRGIMTSTAAPLTVWDRQGGRLLDVSDSACDETQQKHAVLCEGEVAGWVSGGEQAKLVAALLSQLLTRESDKEALLDEILGLYREMNVLFALSGKLARSLEPETVAGTVLKEASRLIKATCGAVVLFHNGQPPRSLAMLGQGIPPKWWAAASRGPEDALPIGAMAEIVNDVPRDPKFAAGWESVRSLICAPLTSKNEAIGGVVLACETPVTYTAPNLKLLTSLALLASAPIENALLYESNVREALEREKLVKQQAEQMGREMDEAMKNITGKSDEVIRSETCQQLLKVRHGLYQLAHGATVE